MVVPASREPLSPAESEARAKARRVPAVGTEQERRRAWGRQWGKVTSDAAAAARRNSA